jgi:hypothetical protein
MGDYWGSTQDAAELIGVSRQALAKQLPMLEYEGVAVRAGYRWKIDLRHVERVYGNLVRVNIRSPRYQLR